MSEATRKPKVFILGVSGLIGYHLARRLQPDFLVSGAYFGNRVDIPRAQLYPVNLKTLEVLETVVRVQNPDILINCMGVTDRKLLAEQPKLGDNINIVLPVSFALLATKMRAQFVQIGCADVFEGDTGNYSEEDTSFTLDDILGKQKITAATYIRAQTLESTTLRAGCVMGLGHPYRLSAFDRLRIKVTRKDQLIAAKKRVHSYISTRSLVNGIHAILSHPFPGKHRTFHLGGPALSEYDFVNGWINVLGQEGLKIKSPQDESARNTSLNSALLARTFPEWQPETKAELYLNLLRDLAPGLGVQKWEKTARAPGI
jgi:dTDP-4-dehydrorhamnose reductase